MNFILNYLNIKEYYSFNCTFTFVNKRIIINL